jgi:hypothetical protein
MPSVFSVVTQPNRVEPPVHALAHAITRVDAPTNSFLEEQVATLPRVTLPYRLFLDTRAQFQALLTWFASVKGRYTTFYIPTWQADLPLTADMTSVATTLTITDIGYTERYFPVEARRHLAFITGDGTITHRRVTASVDNGNGTETLTIASATGIAISKDTDLVSFLLLVRLASDELDVLRFSQTNAECVLECVEVPGEMTA